LFSSHHRESGTRVSHQRRSDDPRDQVGRPAISELPRSANGHRGQNVVLHASISQSCCSLCSMSAVPSHDLSPGTSPSTCRTAPRRRR
jgi:hypothetical protein